MLESILFNLIRILFAIIFLLIFIKKINGQNQIKIVNLILTLIFITMGILSIFPFLHLHFIQNFDVFGYKLFSISRLSGFFLLIYSIIGIGVSIYTNFYFGEYLKHKKNLNLYYFLLILFILSMFGVIMSNEVITFLMFREIMSLSSFFLVVHEFKNGENLKNGNLYLIITHIGMFAILGAFLPFIYKTGTTFFSDRNAIQLTPVLASVSFFLALFGFGSKAGLVPIHLRLPKAHPIAPSNVSALMSGFMVKLPIFMLLKFLLDFFAQSNISIYWFVVTILIGAITAFFGTIFMSIEHHIKKALAFCTIENIGIIFIGLGILILGLYLQDSIIISIGFIAILYHIFNHAILKTILFLGSGGIIERTGTGDFTKLGGLIKKYFFLGFSFLIGILGIIGLPGFNGFNSELLIIVGLFKSLILNLNIWIGLVLIISLILLSVTTIISVVSFVKIFGITFLGNKRDKNIVYKNINSKSENFAYSWLMIFVLLLTIYPGFIVFVSNTILGKNLTIKFQQLFSFGNLGINYIPIVFILVVAFFGLLGYLLNKNNGKYKKNTGQKLRVWNCGYSVIAPKTQYSSSSFTQPLRKIYSNIYSEISLFKHKKIKEKNNLIYKKNLSEIEYKLERKNFFEYIYISIENIFGKLSGIVKSLQDGRTEHYVFYMFLGLLISLLVYYFTL